MIQAIANLRPILPLALAIRIVRLRLGLSQRMVIVFPMLKNITRSNKTYATVKTTNETGVRTVDHLQRTFDYVAEHPVESIFAIGAVVVAVAVAPSAIAAAGAVLTAKITRRIN